MSNNPIGCGPWQRFAEQGECQYCGTSTLVKSEPFGQQDACQSCCEQICYGEGEDE